MAKAFIGATECKMYLGASKIKKAYLGRQRVYSAGNIVTYKVDSGVAYQEEVDSDASCLAPKTFTPAKSGWVFVGWREDATAAGSVFASKVMGDEPVTLYAVFEQAVTLTYYNGSATPTTATKTRYYNNGNVANPTVTLTQAAISGWTTRGWSTDAAGNAGAVYANGATITLTGSLTLYGLYYQTITVTLVTPNGTTYPSGTRYYNSAGSMVNPTFAPVVPAASGWTIRGWSTSNQGNTDITYSSGAAFACTGNITLYSLYYRTLYLYYDGNGATGGAVGAQSGTQYWAPAGTVNPTLQLQACGFSRTNYAFTGWDYGAPGTVVTLTDSITVSAQWVQSVYTYAYTGGMQSFTAPVSGKYLLQVWGAEGGTSDRHDKPGTPGKGGYGAGYVTLTQGQIIYICVGAAGNRARWLSAGAYNGGGASNDSPGGGATHIGTRNGTLVEYGNTNGLFIAAGGGGGAGWGDRTHEPNGGALGMAFRAGDGGGAAGGDGYGYHYADAVDCGRGGTQTAGGISGNTLGSGVFGRGGDYPIDYNYPAGGGGLYGGGSGDAATSDDEFWCGAGGGGSGYIGGVSDGSWSNGQRSGDGCAQITLIA